MPESDEHLMLAYAGGDSAAFETLYSRHKGPLYRYVLRSVKGRGEAEELFQDIWMKVVEAASRYAPQAKFTTWLYTVAHHRLVDHWRAKGLAVVSEQRPVAACIGNEQDHDGHVTVALLEPGPPFERLDIVQPHLRFDADAPSLQFAHRIPGSAIGGDRKRHLRLPWCPSRKSTSESVQQSPMAGVTRGILRRIGPTSVVQPDGRAGQGELPDCHVQELRALDAPECRAIESHGLRRRILAQA